MEVVIEWLSNPSVWIGLLTLVILEIILGIDNLVFIAILANKLPVNQRERARITGISCALIMRLLLLSIMSWLIKLTAPLFSILGAEISGKDLILIGGGIFLIAKATMELHERLETGGIHHAQPKKGYASFGIVVTQIVILDAIFSLDSVITAVGMVDHLATMVVAVIIAMGVMLLASKPLTRFVSAHASVVVLCLSFLLLIGFSLIAEGFDIEIPKESVYAAIGFAIVIEAFNQIARRNLNKAHASIPLRARTADAVLNLLGKGQPIDDSLDQGGEMQANDPMAFHKTERNMVHGVLTLAERSIDSMMTPRADIVWIDSQQDAQKMLEHVRKINFSSVPLCNGSIDEVIGIVRVKDVLDDLLTTNKVNIDAHVKAPIIVPENIDSLELIDTLQNSRGQLVLVADEFGSILGLITPIDVFEVIAGEFPDENETLDIQKLSETRWLAMGAADLHHLEQALDINYLVEDDQDFSTIAGFILDHLEHLPNAGEQFTYRGLHFEVLKVTNRRIAEVIIDKLPEASDLHHE